MAHRSTNLRHSRVFVEALDGLLGLLGCALDDVLAADGREHGDELREGVAQRLVLADQRQDGESERGHVLATDGQVGDQTFDDFLSTAIGRNIWF